MSSAPSPEEALDSLKDFFSLSKEFEDIAYRYLDVQNAMFRWASEEESAALLDEIYLRKAYLDTLRLHTRLPHALLEKCRSMEWYKSDRESLSRHTSLLALMPEASENERIPTTASGLTSRLLEERKELSRHYPHLYSIKALGAPKGMDGKDRHDLHDEVHALETEQAGLSEEEWEAMEMKRGEVEAAIISIQEADPLFLEESLPTWKEIRNACEVIASENEGRVRVRIAEMIRGNDPMVQSVLTRFVLESMMFRLMLEDRTADLDGLLKRWLGEDRPTPDDLIPLTREEVNRSLDIMEQLFSDPFTAYSKMIDAAHYMGAEGDTAWNMVQAVLSRSEESDFWPELALNGVVTMLSSREGRQEELSRAILARGEREGSLGTVAAGLAAMAVSLHSLGRLDESGECHRSMMDAMIAGRDDPDVLIVYPLAASISLQMGDKKSVRKLAGAGIRRMEDFPELDEQREQLLELRRSVDRVDKEKGQGVIDRSGRGSRNKKRGR